MIAGNGWESILPENKVWLWLKPSVNRQWHCFKTKITIHIASSPDDPLSWMYWTQLCTSSKRCSKIKRKTAWTFTSQQQEENMNEHREQTITEIWKCFPELLLKKGDIAGKDRVFPETTFQLGLKEDARDKTYFWEQYPPKPGDIEAFHKEMKSLQEAGIWGIWHHDTVVYHRLFQEQHSPQLGYLKASLKEVKPFIEAGIWESSTLRQ